MKRIRHYLSLVKFSHTIFAMPFALIGFFMGVMQAEQNSPLNGWQKTKEYFSNHGEVFLFIVICMVTARSAAMAFNRYLDREFDAKNPRTAIREIPKGIISPSSALRFTIANSIVFMWSAWMINISCFLLSPIALLVILGYSYTKRFTPLCHLILGLGLSLAPTGAFIAVTEHASAAVICLSAAVIGWVSGFDIIYALQDDEFDIKQGLYSIPSFFGRKNALFISRCLHAATAVFLISVGLLQGMHFVYFIGLVIYVGLLIYQQSIVKVNDLSKVNIAFMTANGAASIAFAYFTIMDLVYFG
ncbi:MAG: 4-hydroxybenzoate octaprenyltransferase [Cytophagia bacterium]|nr:4-hydroxybenzoate octaprenyltransferase [Cytophagia bacterium]